MPVKKILQDTYSSRYTGVTLRKWLITIRFMSVIGAGGAFASLLPLLKLSSSVSENKQRIYYKNAGETHRWEAQWEHSNSMLRSKKWCVSHKQVASMSRCSSICASCATFNISVGTLQLAHSTCKTAAFFVKATEVERTRAPLSWSSGRFELHCF